MVIAFLEKSVMLKLDKKTLSEHSSDDYKKWNSSLLCDNMLLISEYPVSEHTSPNSITVPPLFKIIILVMCTHTVAPGASEDSLF